MPRNCKPISMKTAFSSRNCTVRQFVVSAIRDAAVCNTGARCPSISPVTTTATAPDACAA